MSDYLSEEEQLARLASWWKQNGTLIVVTLVVVAAAVIGWRWYESYAAERVTKASDLYVEFLEASGNAREKLAAELEAGGAATAYPALILLQRAQEEAGAGNLEAAAESLGKAVELASGPLLKEVARLRLARVQYGLGRHDQALATLGEIRSAGFLPIAQELKGDVHLARGERKEAHAAYVAALGDVLAEDQRAMLEIKVADTADASGS